MTPRLPAVRDWSDFVVCLAKCKEMIVLFESSVWLRLIEFFLFECLFQTLKDIAKAEKFIKSLPGTKADREAVIQIWLRDMADCLQQECKVME